MCPGPEVAAAYPGRDDLGEGPCWDERAQLLLRVDIKRGFVHHLDLDSGRGTSLRIEPPVSFAIPRAVGGFVVGISGGVATVNGKDVALIAEIEASVIGNRLNDAKCDRRGRLWAGTMSLTREPGAAALYRIEPDGSVHIMLDGLTISNGLDWNLVSDRMYLIDSTTQRIDVFDFDLDAGSISNRRCLTEIDPSDGLPDGLTVDSDDHIWIALFGGGAIRRYTPSGKLDCQIALPVTNPTSLAFAGRRLDALYITSAQHRLSEEELAAEPLAGALLRVAPVARGRAPNRFAG